jgi:hypothetical protein
VIIEKNEYIETEPLEIVAKTCGCKGKENKVIYSFVDDQYGLCIDKKDIISTELEACERLLNIQHIMQIQKVNKKR